MIYPSQSTPRIVKSLFTNAKTQLTGKAINKLDIDTLFFLEIHEVGLTAFRRTSNANKLPTK